MAKKESQVKTLLKPENKTEIWTISNILTLTRILLLPWIIYFFVQDTRKSQNIAFGLMVLAALTDLSDGFLARKLNQKTNLGKILDPIADKLALVSVGILLVIYRNLPIWLLIILVIRDSFYGIYGYALLRKGVVPEARLVGKLTTTSLALTFLFYLLKIRLINTIFLYVSGVLIVISMFDYGKRFLRASSGLGWK
ncbi:putative CDP-diacylglycerol--glycerol-3-phosphate 3-phosphatidyl-transferase 2 [bacterium BMS3Abin05]|nr:putative CDP-diacylglycerol--glycerol-3-phosphate 3-phosphatidyl-transferase 2 [bacterium BMS3Abin05]GBE26414.1 putative CDP-diacylglycerol--glycerol-3-phosphate 3-phosphatidyl-transferase 2 [bacterium BMS3Bbin03]